MDSMINNGRPTPPNISLDPNDLRFGRVFTPNMFLMQYSVEKGWHSPEIKPMENFSLHPATMCLHYGQTIFEGQKAFRRDDGRIVTFRPDQHLARLNRSARRMVIPEIDEDLVFQAMKELVALDKDWVPSPPGALYIRPTIIATDPFLGVAASGTYYFFIILSPVGSYIQGGLSGIRAVTQTEFSRACSGGTGAVKTGGNYAASLLAGKKAKDQGYHQVIWLDAREHKYIEEMGAMNLLFVEQGTLVTSPLTGSILPGITRKSLSQLAPDLGIPFEERMVSIDELCEGIDSGRVTEVLGAGTAAVITPVGSVTHQGVEHEVGDGKPGPIARKLYDTLTGIQYGHREDPYGWMVELVS